MIELTSPANRIVCSYQEGGFGDSTTRLTLVGVRNNKTLQEIPVSDFKDDWHYVVREFPLTNFDEVVKASETLNPLSQEGYVVVDGAFNRVKIKSPKYVAIHHLKDGFGTRRIIDLIKMGEQSELLSYMPEYQVMYDAVHDKIKALIRKTEEDFADTMGVVGTLCTQKEFALEAVKSRVSGALFAVRSGKYPSIEKFILDMNTLKIEELIS